MTLLRGDALGARLGRATVLDGASVSLAAGELVGLIGPNGAGKSTLLRLMSGLLAPTAGRVLYREQPISGMAAKARAQALAYLAQDSTVHWPITAERVVALGRLPHGRAWPQHEDERAAVDRALAATRTEDLRQRAVGRLSGGERARVMLARALAVEAPVLLVDEPIAALDPHHQLHVMELLRETAHRGTGVMAILHDLTLAARFCDRLVLLHQGRILAEGRPAEVLDAANLATAYRVTAATGEHAGERFIVPWQRLDDQARPARMT